MYERKVPIYLKLWYEQYGPKDTPDTLEVPDKVFKRYRSGRTSALTPSGKILFDLREDMNG